MVPAYAGYLAVEVLSGFTRGWLTDKGTAIDALNPLAGNMTAAHEKRYSLTDESLTRYVRDYYSYLLDADGRPDVVHPQRGIPGGLSPS